jgi:hypothetical protein
MTSNCINCSIDIEHNFCPICGQNKHVPKIDKKFILHDLQHGIFHFDNSFIYTLFSLFKEPAVVIKKFIHGNRKHYANPFTLVFFLATVFTIITTKLISNGFIIDNGINSSSILYEITHNKAWLVLLILPILSLLTYIFFKKSGYNYFEILVYECFIQSKIIIIHFLFLPLHYFFSNALYINISIILVVEIIALRAKVLFFDQYSFGQVIIRTILTRLISTIISVILIFFIAFIFSI